VPELPDITVYIEALDARIRGATLEQAEIRNPFLLRTVEPPVARCVGRRVTELRRLGKRIAIGFDNDNAGRLGTKKLTDALKRRLPLVTVVRWQRKDPSDRGDPSDPISLDQLKDEAYRALAARQDWFSLALSKAIKPKA